MKWKELYKLGVTGSRKFPNPSNVVQYLERYIAKNFESTEDVVIITGNALGVDTEVEMMCVRRGIKNLIVNARWLELSVVAGPRRNEHIVALSNSILAFWDGSSKGTKDCIDKARLAGKEITVFSNADLIKELNVKPPVEIIVPKTASNKIAHRMREFVDDADITGLMIEASLRKKKKKKKRVV